MVTVSRFRLPRGAMGLSVLTLLLAGGPAPAQVSYDAQIPFDTSGLTNALQSPRGVAVAPDGTVYVADVDGGSGQVVRISSPGTVGGAAGTAAVLSGTATSLAITVSGSGVALEQPSAVAVDSKGDLFIADIGLKEVLELFSPETSGIAAKVASYPGSDPTALAVDSSNNLYVADEAANAVYEISSGSLVKTISAAMPVGLATDSSGNVYFASAKAGSEDVYEYAQLSGLTTVFLGGSYGFDFSGAISGLPIGMGFDPAGNFYVLDSASAKLTEVTAASGFATAFHVPFSSIAQPGSLTVSAIGNLYMSDDSNRAVEEIFYNNNPVNFGSRDAGTRSARVTVNYLFASGVGGLKFYQSMQGDNTGEFKTPSSVCAGGAGSSCTLLFAADYLSTTPGLRSGVFGLTDGNNDIFAVPSIGISLAGGLALYPGTQTTLPLTSQPLYEPQGLAVTGDGGQMFIADEGGALNTNPPTYQNGAVYRYPKGGGTRKQVYSSGTTPTALALDSAGNLYVADYAGTVSIVSPASSWGGFSKTLTLSGGAALNHPMALTFDAAGNLYIGDMGPGGTAATAANPGYIVKVPVGPLVCNSITSTCQIEGGPAVKLDYQVGGIPVVFPQALATDNLGNLYIADGGDGQTDPGGLVAVVAATGMASTLPVGSYAPLNQPTGLSFDAANDLYVLDGYNVRVLVLPISYLGDGTPTVADSGNATTLLGQGSSGITASLVTPSNLVVWPGGQQITITDLGFQPQSGPPTPPQVITLDAMNTTVDVSTGSGSVTGVNVGNTEITFLTPNRVGTVNGGAAFSLSGCGTDSTTLEPGVTPACTPTISYDGSGVQTATFTLNGDASTDFSALGNTIFATAEPNEPFGVLSGPTFTFSQVVTITLKDSGSQPLQVTNIAVTGGAFDTGNGTCASNTLLQPTQSCTVIMQFTAFFSDGTVTVTDNSGNVPGTNQSFSTFFIF